MFITESENLACLCQRVARDTPGIFDGVSFEMSQSLVAPAAIMSEYIHRDKKVFSKDKLDVLLVGAELFDAAFSGSYYQLIPKLLNRSDMQVNITMVCPTLVKLPFELNPNTWISRAKKAKIHECNLGAFCEENDIEGFDIAFIFHPGFEAHWSEWVFDQPSKSADDENGIMQLLDSVSTIVSCSYDQHEYEIDRAILMELGIGISSPYKSKFSVDIGKGETPVPVVWGNTIWKFNGSFNPELGLVDFEKISQLRTEYDGITEDQLISSLHSVKAKQKGRF